MNNLNLKDIFALEIKIFPLILNADKGGSLWHLLRALDTNGSGKVCLTKKQLVEYLGTSESTIYKRLKSKLFRDVVRNKKEYTIYLASKKQVCELLGIDDLITSAYGTFNDIRQENIKQTIAEILIASIQKRSMIKASKSRKGRRVLTMEDIFRKPSDRLTGVSLTKDQLCFNSDHFAPYGASQATVAKILGRTQQCISKWLSKTVSVKQQITYSGIEEDYTDAKEAMYDVFPSSTDYAKCKKELGRYVEKPATSIYKDNTIWKKYCNLYFFSSEWQLGWA